MDINDVVQIKIEEARRKTEAAKRRRAERDTARQAGVEQRHRAKLAHLAAKDTAAVERVRSHIRRVLACPLEQLATACNRSPEWAAGYAAAARAIETELSGEQPAPRSRNPTGNVPPELPPAA